MVIIMNPFVIYLIGFVITYLFLKYLDWEQDSNDWSDIFARFFVSLFSWIAVFLIVILLIFSLFEYLKNTKPPKWL